MKLTEAVDEIERMTITLKNQQHTCGVLAKDRDRVSQLLLDAYNFENKEIERLQARVDRLEHELALCHEIADCVEGNCNANGWECPAQEATEQDSD